jgi:uncharacterized protein YjbJ (UPF0337 family)
LFASEQIGDYKMKALLWIIAGAGVGLAAYVVLNQPGLQYASGNDGVEQAADKTTMWGSKQRISGAGKGLVGKLKEGLGKMSGDEGLAGEGVADQVVGTVKDAAGKAAHAVGETIHDLNR